MTTPTQTIVVPAADDGESWLKTHRGLLIGAGVGALLALALCVWAVIAMVDHPAQTQTIRDVFIIFMALEALVIGLALVVLIVQMSLLTTVLRHEIKPILDSAGEAARTLRGTAAFVSRNVVDPVIKVQASVAAVRQALHLLRPDHRP
jgi:hypothetical protein